MKTLTAKFKKTYLPERTFAYIRNIGPYMGNTSLFERLFNLVGDYLKTNGLFRNNTESLSIYHDDPDSVPADKQRISVGFTVPPDTEGFGEIKIMPLPAGNYAIGSFRIEQNEYGDAWQALFDFVQKEGLKPRGLMYESYKNDPTQDPEGKHVVDICVAV